LSPFDKAVNFILLEPEDFIEKDRVRIEGRRLDHIRGILGSVEGSELRIGVLNDRIGKGRVERIDNDALEMSVSLDTEPPKPLPLRLILALPRPKVLNRTIAAAASMGIRKIDLINSWRVEKSYWDSPRLLESNLRMQCMLGLEQAGDTVLPTIRLHRLFTPFVRGELRDSITAIKDCRALLAHPGADIAAPRNISEPAVLAIGPEGGFIEREVATFQEIGFASVNLGPRILRVETAIACLVGRLF
jgi:RsmE family RNA methyltransferase